MDNRSLRYDDLTRRCVSFLYFLGYIYTYNFDTTNFGLNVFFALSYVAQYQFVLVYTDAGTTRRRRVFNVHCRELL
jgi:hypothetical protein